ncbi:MAG: 2-hydroxyacyl-CoA dehydratase family protein [Candidatus Adiutrix sp.]|jgi:benzoyl-CoA reductase/2-hydroxyglutaryl-CoA dehydratase subunit BcrC/BadD/HgdB|nr:2-hydroxyacyl-CoA dehydratase family protein [Candidatus Adiutrix sp.]
MTVTDRENRIREKIRSRCDEEVELEISLLRQRKDYFPELDYFLDLLSAGQSSSVIAGRVGRPVAALLCLQAPLELFQAYGLHPFKVFGGSQAASRLSSPSLPAVMCPMLRSALGLLQLDSASAGDSGGFAAWVLPTTCDWAVKFMEMMANCGQENRRPVHRLELPHLKDRDESQGRWLEEIYGLRNFLGELTGRKKPDRGALARSMAVYQKAWQVFTELTMLKRAGRLSGPWSVVISNSFFFDDVQKWMAAVEATLPKFRERPAAAGPEVYLAGSPVFFPNLKIMHLLEDAGLKVVMDDLCSSERLFPGAVFFDDPSEHGLLKALAQRYHQGCLCPSFADNDRRINNIISPSHKALYRGVVFQVLKGCHPFDLESMTLERRLKDEGLKFIKVETDYTSEDSQNLLTRLEAYRRTLDS